MLDNEGVKTVVLGLGNVLLSDEGVGVHAANALAERGVLPAGTKVLAIGTALLDALPELEKAERIIVMDAMKAGGPPGTVYRIPFDECRRPQTIASMHGFDLSRVLTLAGRSDSPDVRIFGVEPAQIGWSLELSDPVAAAMPALLAAVSKEACKRAADK
jgi:hydrogenase maturation protease